MTSFFIEEKSVKVSNVNNVVRTSNVNWSGFRKSNCSAGDGSGKIN